MFQLTKSDLLVIKVALLLLSCAGTLVLVRYSKASHRTCIFWACAALILSLVWSAVVYQRPLGSEISPDGSLRADYFYSCGDPICWLLEPEVNPVLYLVIRDVRTGDVVSKDEYLGDAATLDEARERFSKRLPWAIQRD